MESVYCAVRTESLYKTHVKLIAASRGTQLWLLKAVTARLSEHCFHSEGRKPVRKNKQIYVLGAAPTGPPALRLVRGLAYATGQTSLGAR